MMYLTDEEKAMLDGKHGLVIQESIDNIIQFGEAFGAERLVDISFCIYPAEQSIYEGMVEEAVGFAERGAKVRIPAPSTTLACDLERPGITGCPKPLEELQAKIEEAHRKMGVLETCTCTPQNLGFIPPFGSYTALVESSAIIYYNSVLGVRSNRGGMFTRFAAFCGKYPLMGYLLDENRKGTHLFKVNIPPEKLNSYVAYSALGMYIGTIAGSNVPVISGIKPTKQEYLIGLGAALATSGSVTLFHIPGVTPEAGTVEEAFQGDIPANDYEVTEQDLINVINKWTNIEKGSRIDFVTLGCPHYNLEQIRIVAEKLKGKKIADNVRFWVCTNRMTRKQAEYSGYMKTIEDAGALVIADTCPVESHMRISTCRDYGLKVPNVEAMVSESGKMIRYVGDLIGCKTALADIDKCIECAISGRWE
ncbi:aconitase X [Bacteroidota bacterium]